MKKIDTEILIKSLRSKRKDFKGYEILVLTPDKLCSKL